VFHTFTTLYFISTPGTKIFCQDQIQPLHQEAGEHFEPEPIVVNHKPKKVYKLEYFPKNASALTLFATMHDLSAHFCF